MKKQSVMDLANSFRESRKQCLVRPVEKSVENVENSRKTDIFFLYLFQNHKSSFMAKIATC